MRTILCTYLLMKSLLGKKFTYFDIDLAKAMKDDLWWPKFVAPTYVFMVANLSVEEKLPEVWSDFMWEILNGYAS